VGVAGMKKQLISFQDFLKTGALGPISLGMKMIDVARELGAPDSWITEHAETIPPYWIYGKLEISFDEDPPYPMNWFQIEQAGYLEGDFDILADELVLSLGGFSGTTKPSEFLSAGLWPPESVTVSYYGLGDDIVVTISAGPVELHFRIDTDFLADGDAPSYLDRTALPQLIKTVDGQADMLDSIYSYPHHSLENIESSRDIFGWKSLSGSEYLAYATAT
jgi:hypothetical protein